MDHATRTFCFIIFVILSSCNSLLDHDPNEIIARAIEAHGGFQNWQQIDSLIYQKTTLLFDEQGNKESEITQLHKYKLLPTFSASIQWSKDSTAHHILYQNGSVNKLVDGVTIYNSVTLNAAFNATMAAHYVVSQPFKLLDPGVQLTYEGQETLEGGALVNVIKAAYDQTMDNHTKSDGWWYYFDVKTHLCVANMVKHGNTFSYIKNLEYDQTTDIVFNRHRKSYRVDKDRNIRFLRAEYFYGGYEIK